MGDRKLWVFRDQTLLPDGQLVEDVNIVFRTCGYVNVGI